MERHNCVIKGQELSYLKNTAARAAGAQKHIPMLCIHGNTASSIWWERVLPLLHADAWALDLPNFGHSADIDSSSIETYTKYVTEFIDAVVGSPVLLIGHSFGGAISMNASIHHPAVLSGLVLICSVPPGGFITPEERYPLLAQLHTERTRMREVLQAVMPRCSDESWVERIVDHAIRLSPEALLNHAREMASFDLHSQVAASQVPTWTVWGDQDTLITRTMAEETASAFPISPAPLNVLQGIGHSPMVEDPQTCATLINEAQTYLHSLR